MAVNSRDNKMLVARSHTYIHHMICLLPAVAVFPVVIQEYCSGHVAYVYWVVHKHQRHVLVLLHIQTMVQYSVVILAYC
jgi:hypothetical protein